MSESSTLFIRQDESMPYCPRELYLDDSDSDAEAETPMTKEPGNQSSPEVVEDDSDDDTIYCVCRKTASGFMVGCDGGCEDWFHGACVDIKPKQKDLLKQFVCPDCTKNGNGMTSWEDDEDDKGDKIKEEDKEEEDRVMPDADNDEDEDNSAVLGPAGSLRQMLADRLSARKSVMKRLDVSKAIYEKRIGGSRLRAQPTPKLQTPAPPTFSAAKFMPIAEKLRYSLPTFASTPPGFRSQLKVVDNRDDGGEDGDDDMNSARNGRTANLDILLATRRHANKPIVKVQRRTYIDVEEAPTYVDVIVKESLEEALFGARDD